MAELGEAVVAAAGIVGEAGFFDQRVADEAVEGAVERAGTESDAAASRERGLFHDGVAVFVAAGQGKQDGEDGGSKGNVTGIYIRSGYIVNG
jgi:hypothetical protein